MKRKIFAGIVAGFVPVIAFAQTTTGGGVFGLIRLAQALTNQILPVLIGVAVVWFIWEVFQYTISGNEDKKKKAKDGMVWGIVGIFVMVAVWGLVGILVSTLCTSGTTSCGTVPPLPILPHY